MISSIHLFFRVFLLVELPFSFLLYDHVHANHIYAKRFVHYDYALGDVIALDNLYFLNNNNISSSHLSHLLCYIFFSIYYHQLLYMKLSVSV
jgi:hypothetical protein